MNDERKVLITAFGPFAGVAENPSERLVRRLETVTPGAGLVLETAVLPVVYDEVGARLEPLLAASRHDAVILTGVRRSADTVCIERVALNLDDSATPDTGGDVRRGVPIDPAGPPAYISALDLAALADAFSAAGEPAVVSNHAGAYLCNRVYYLARRALDTRAEDVPCVFVHLPAMPTPVDADRIAALVTGTLTCAWLLAG